MRWEKIEIGLELGLGSTEVIFVNVTIQDTGKRERDILAGFCMVL